MAFIRNVDKLIEGLENKFFTEARAKAALAPELAAEESARLAGDAAEAAARQAADNSLDARLDVIEGSGEGSVAKAEQDAKDYADQKVAALVNSAPAVLDTLKELSDALGGDENFATTVAGQIGVVDDKVDQEILDRQSAVSAEQSARESADQALDGRLDVLEADPTTKSYVDGEVSDLQGQITQEISDRQQAISDEEDARELADSNLSSRISVLEQDPVTKAYVDGEVSDLQGQITQEISDRQSDVNAEESRALAAEGLLDGRIDVLEQDPTTKAYVDGIQSALDSRLDVLESDPVTKTYVDGEVSDLQGQITQEISDRQAAIISVEQQLASDIASVEGQIEAEQLARESADNALDGRLDILEQDPVTKSYVDSEVLELDSLINAYNTDLDARLDIVQGADSVEGSIAKAEKDAKEYADGIVESEEQRAMSAEAALDGRLDILEQDPVTKTYVDGEVSDLQGQVNTEKGRIDAILSASEADKDSFAEIVQLINSVDTSNDSAFASYVLSNDAALAQEISDREADVDAEESRAMAAEGLLDGRLDVLESDPTTKTYVDGEISDLQSQITQEISDRQSDVNAEESRALAAEGLLDGRLDVLEADPTTKSYVDSQDLNLQSQIEQEESARQLADEDLDSRLDVLELDPVTKAYVDTADGQKANRALDNLTLNASIKVDALPSAANESTQVQGSMLFTNKPHTFGATYGGNTLIGLHFNPATMTSSGVCNTAFGTNTLRAATSSALMTVMGFNAGRSVTTASYSVFIGAHAGRNHSTGVDNVAVGSQALYSATGSSANTAIGALAMLNATGTYNTAVGSASLRDMTSASGNVALGTDAGRRATGSNNTFLGAFAGSSTNSGSNNIIIGPNIQASSATASNEINIGDVYKANSSQIILNKDVEMVSGQKVKYSTKAVNYTLVASDYIVAVSDLSVSRVMTLPSASTMGAGKVFIIKEQSGAASQSNYIQILPQSGQQIDGQSDYKVVMPYESVMLVSNGTHWFII